MRTATACSDRSHRFRRETTASRKAGSPGRRRACSPRPADSAHEGCSPNTFGSTQPPTPPARHCSTVSSSRGMAGAPMPALLNRTSSRPKTSTVRVKRARMESGVGHVGRDRDRPPVDPISEATSLMGSGRRSDSTSANPSAARARAAALPTPVPAPVTTATLAASSAPFALMRLSCRARSPRRLYRRGRPTTARPANTDVGAFAYKLRHHPATTHPCRAGAGGISLSED